MNSETLSFEPTKAEEEKPSRRIFLEVGLEPKGLFLKDVKGDKWLAHVPLGGVKKWDQDEVWIGVDIDESRVKETKRWSDYEKQFEHDYKSRIKRGQMLYLTANGTEMPLDDHAVETVFFGNQFGDPDIKDSVKLKFLKEAKRLLKSGGQIVILESRTPEISRLGTWGGDYGEFNPPAYHGKNIQDMLDETGFEITDYIPVDDPRWNDKVEKYSTKMVGFYNYNFERQKPYLVFAKVSGEQAKSRKD